MQRHAPTARYSDRCNAVSRMCAQERLEQRFAQLPRDVIERVLTQASVTVERMTGQPDPGMAADLAELRLQILQLSGTHG